MTLNITINPEASSNLSPYQLTKPKAPDMVNDEFFASFGDLIDLINPLQHLPGVSTLYRAVTQDTIGTGAKIAGGALFGGPIGLISSIANVIFEQESGKDLGGLLLASVTDKYEKAAELS